MKTLIVLTLALALTAKAAPKVAPAMPPMPKLVTHRLALRSPKAASLAARPRLVAHPSSPVPSGYYSQHLLTTNGFDVDVLIPYVAASSGRAKSVVQPAIRAVLPPYYAHKEDWHNVHDVIYVKYSGVESNHVYQVSWTNGDPTQRRPTQDYVGTMIYPTNWTGWSKAQFGYIPWYGPPGSLLQVGMSIDNMDQPTNDSLAHLLSWNHGFFRLQDVTGQ